MTIETSRDTQRAFNDQDANPGIGFSIYVTAPRVLHVDSDPDTALVLSALLVPETRVTHVATLAAAQELLQTEQFALVVIDPDLQDGDADLLLHNLHHLQHDARVLLYSARHPDRYMVGCSFLPKPWTSPRQLWRTVSDMLNIGNAMPAEPQ
jgi:two-component system phosphate regulon response regulator OmpR